MVHATSGWLVMFLRSVPSMFMVKMSILSFASSTRTLKVMPYSLSDQLIAESPCSDLLPVQEFNSPKKKRIEMTVFTTDKYLTLKVVSL